MEVFVKRQKSISYSISRPRISEPEKDQTRGPPVRKKKQKKPELFSVAYHSASLTGKDTFAGGSFSQVSCPFSLTTLFLPREVFEYKWD